MAISNFIFHFFYRRIGILVCIVADMERILRLTERWKDTKAPMILKGVLDTASPSGAVHVGPSVASRVLRPRVNSPCGLNRCDKIILAILLHEGFCTVFLEEAKLPEGCQRGRHPPRYKNPSPMWAGEDVQQVTFEVRFCFYLCDYFAAVY